MDGLRRRDPTTQSDQSQGNTPQADNKPVGKLKLQRLKQNPLLALMAVGVVALLVGLFIWYDFGSDNTVRPEAVTPIEQAADYYDPLTPDTSDIDFYFDTDRMVFSFNDVYNDVALTISQQPAPDNIQSDPEELIDIARHMQAENSIETDQGTAYITSEDSSSSQTALFTTGEILIFIESSRTLTFEEWQEYINSLSRQ